MLMKAVASSRLRFLAPTRFALLLSTLAVLLTPVFLTITAGFLARGQSPDPPSIKVVDLIPASLSGESNQDSEPFLAIQNQNPQVMVASAFTPNPFSMTGNAPLYVSQDGGKTWVLNAITPVQRMTCDITHAMATGENHPRGDLHAGTLACASAITLDESESNDVSLSTTMNVQSTRGNVDQPFVRALGVASGYDRRIRGRRRDLQIDSH